MGPPRYKGGYWDEWPKGKGKNDIGAREGMMMMMMTPTGVIKQKGGKRTGGGMKKQRGGMKKQKGGMKTGGERRNKGGNPGETGRSGTDKTEGNSGDPGIQTQKKSKRRARTGRREKEREVKEMAGRMPGERIAGGGEQKTESKEV